MQPVISIRGLRKAYASGHQALKGVDLDIARGEIFALLGPNGAGKTTLIGAICGLVTATGGTVLVDGYDNVRQYREARARIGLVPQELYTDQFEPVGATVAFSRGLFGRPPNPALVEELLRELTVRDGVRDRLRLSRNGGDFGCGQLDQLAVEHAVLRSWHQSLPSYCW